MSGLLRRLKRRGPATADENRSPAAETSEPVAAPAETPAEPGGRSPVPGSEPGGEQPTVALPATSEQTAAHPLPAWSVAASQPTGFAAQPAPARDLPAGVDPHELAGAPAASARRGKLRRRLRYLRHVRELLLRDLGGFTYEIHRTAGGTTKEQQRRLAEAKAQRISALDDEVLALESQLGEPHGGTILREPGIGGTCPECGELHASDARFCARCGTPLDEKARAQRAAEQPATGSQEVVAEPQPASVLWAGGPRPDPEPAPAEEQEEEPAQPPSAATSEWLATDRPTTFSRAPKPDEDDQPAPSGWTKPDEPAPKTDEPSTAEQPGDVPPGPATVAGSAKPKRAAKAEPEPQANEASSSANGRRDDDVPPPFSSGDPLTSPREERP